MIESAKAARDRIRNKVRENPRRYGPWLAGLAGLVFLLIGVAIAFIDKEPWSALSQAVSGLGSAIVGGAIVAFVVLFVEARSGEEAEKRAFLRQIGLWKDVKGLDLRKGDLRGAYWREINLRFANLAEAHLDDRTRLWDCDFFDAFLFGVVSPKADLSGANLTGAYLGGADLKGARLEGAIFDGANLGEQTDLDGEILGSAILTETNLTGANLIGANLTGVDLQRAVFKGADLRGARLTGADLTGADLTGSLLLETVLNESDSGRKTDLSGTRLVGALLNGADLSGALLKSADLTGASLGRGQDLLTGEPVEGANLTNADLRGAVFKGVYLTGATLTGADIRGANFDQAIATQEDFEGVAEWDNVTWPSEIGPPGGGS